MKKLAFITIILALLLAFSSPIFAKTAIIGPLTSLTGGGTGALDKVECNDILMDNSNRPIAMGDIALVVTADSEYYIYRYNATGTASEDSPRIILPDNRATCSGQGQWELVKFNAIGFYGQGSGTSVVNIPPGSAPGSPNNGDIWDTSAGFYVRVNGVTIGPLVGSGGALGTPSNGTLTNCTGLPVSGITASTSTALGVGSLDVGHASDTTLARVSAGVVSVEGKTVPRIVASGSVSFDPGSVSDGACSSEVDGGTANEVAATDRIVWNVSGDPTSTTGYTASASGWIWAYPTTDHVKFRFCNKTGSALDPATVTINWMVLR